MVSPLVLSTQELPLAHNKELSIGILSVFLSLIEVPRSQLPHLLEVVEIAPTSILLHSRRVLRSLEGEVVVRWRLDRFEVRTDGRKGCALSAFTRPLARQSE